MDDVPAHGTTERLSRRPPSRTMTFLLTDIEGSTRAGRSTLRTRATANDAPRPVRLTIEGEEPSDATGRHGAITGARRDQAGGEDHLVGRRLRWRSENPIRLDLCLPAQVPMSLLEAVGGQLAAGVAVASDEGAEVRVKHNLRGRRVRWQDDSPRAGGQRKRHERRTEDDPSCRVPATRVHRHNLTPTPLRESLTTQVCLRRPELSIPPAAKPSPKRGPFEAPVVLTASDSARAFGRQSATMSPDGHRPRRDARSGRRPDHR